MEVDAAKFSAFAARRGIAVESLVLRPLAGGQRETLLPFHAVEEFQSFARFFLHE
jgi:hypothetical protein